MNFEVAGSVRCVHPMERLRHLARAGPVEHAVLVRESAVALAALDGDPGGLLLSIRRLLERHGGSGPLWWLCARMQGAEDAGAEAWRCVRELDADPTPGHLARDLPDDATVAVVGWPEVAAAALARRGDVRVLAVDALGEGVELWRWLRHRGVVAVEVPESGLGAAVAAADVVVLEAAALGPAALLAVAGSGAAAAVAAVAGVPVWVVAGVGRALPGELWAGLVGRRRCDRPWLLPDDVVALDLGAALVGPAGLVPLPAPPRADCSAAPELSPPVTEAG